MMANLSSPIWKILIIPPSMTSMQYCCHGPLEVHRHCPWKQLHCRQKLYWAAGAQEHVLSLKRVRCTLVTQIVHHIFVFRGFAYMYVHVSLYNYYVCIYIYNMSVYYTRIDTYINMDMCISSHYETVL